MSTTTRTTVRTAGVALRVMLVLTLARDPVPRRTFP